MRQLPVAREVKRQRFVPLLFARVDLERPAASGVVNQNLDHPERIERLLRHCARISIVHRVVHDDRRRWTVRRNDLSLQLLELFATPAGDGQANALAGQDSRRRAADAGAGAGHKPGATV